MQGGGREGGGGGREGGGRGYGVGGKGREQLLRDKVEDGDRKIQMKPPKKTNVGVALASFDP